MPVVDWTRTELRHPMPNGALALRFDAVDFAAYDVLVLKRPGAADDYSPARLAEADRGLLNTLAMMLTYEALPKTLQM